MTGESDACVSTRCSWCAYDHATSPYLQQTKKKLIFLVAFFLCWCEKCHIIKISSQQDLKKGNGAAPIIKQQQFWSSANDSSWSPDDRLKWFEKCTPVSRGKRMNGVMQQLLSLTFSSLLNQVADVRNNIGMLEQDSPSHHFSYQEAHIWKTFLWQDKHLFNEQCYP